MARFTKKNKNEIGRAPDELFFRGEKKIEDVKLNVFDFDATHCKALTLSKTKDAIKYRDTSSITWFNIDGLHNIEALKNIGLIYELDKLVVADILNTQARAKINEYHNCLSLSIKMLRQNNNNYNIIVENLSIVLTKTTLLSFQEYPGDVFNPIRNRIQDEKTRIRNSGIDYLMFAILDIVVDNYIYVLSVLGDKIESLEEQLLDNPGKDVLEQINIYKKELNFIRKNINPAKEMILFLSKLDSDFIKEETNVHYQSLVGNINQAIEITDSYREIISDQLNIYHTTISSKLNDVIKILTIFSVIFIPLTFIAGIYGTNFEYVPELKFKYSYFIMWGVMIVVAILMLLYFKRKKWL